MTTKKTVWILTTGSYSDYKVEGVFSTKEAAQNVKDTFNAKDWNDIEEYQINQLAQHLNNPMSMFVIMLSDGQYTVLRSYDDLDYGNRMTIYQPPQRDVESNVRAYIITDTEERAIKVFTEKLSMMVANDITHYKW